ncbi:MAG: transketolase [Planctomycetes bacterium]|nr:transketolase [Planctomycetota bacterium]MCW8135880.1 transketolase [Planctomycetota bacterium]
MPALTPELESELRETARKLRIDVIEMLWPAGSGHPGGSLGMADIFACLYFGGFVRHDPQNPLWPDRDRVVLSNGHICPILYSVLGTRGYFPREWYKTLRKLDSHLQGHPAMQKTPGVELSTGSLGHGVCGALGMALAERLSGRDSRVYALCGDGELQEGLPWEGFMAAAHHKADNLTVIVDRNDAQIDGKTEDVMSLEPLADKFRAFGFHTQVIDGHDYGQIFTALNAAGQVKGKPQVIIANTIMGKGVKFMEADGYKWHGKTPGKDQAMQALKDLGA